MILPLEPEGHCLAEAGFPRCAGVAPAGPDHALCVFGLKRVFRVGRFDRAAPWTIKSIQQLLGRRLARIDDAIERFQMPGLVPPEMVDAATPAQARMRERKAFLGDLEQIAVADLCLEAKPRHVITQRLALMGVPVPGDVPGGIEADIVIKQTN